MADKRTISLRIPELGFIAGTRGALGAGLGLLLADRLTHRQQKKLGRLLLTIGAATTVPILINVIRKARRSRLLAA
jgi:hypothetical protein